MSQTVRDVMTGIPITVAPDQSLTEAARTMRDFAIGCVLVGTGDDIRGIVTDRDIVVRAVAEARDPATLTVDDICTVDVAVVTPEHDIEEAVKIMQLFAVRRLPVVEHGKAVGIMSLGDLAVERCREGMHALAAISAAPPRG